MECEKLAQEKTEMQRHYVMYYEMSYGLNVEMHKQTEIGKRLDAIIRQVLPFLSAEHQTQVAMAVERAKQITMGELNAAMQVRYTHMRDPIKIDFRNRPLLFAASRRGKCSRRSAAGSSSSRGTGGFAARPRRHPR